MIVEIKNHTVSKISAYSGKTNIMNLPISKEIYLQGEAKRKTGMPVQTAFPMLNADQREFLISGMTPEEWEHLHNPNIEISR